MQNKPYVTSQDYYRTLKMFIEIASKHKLLNKKEEQAMIERHKDEPEKLKQLLINHNIRIVMNIANRYVKRTYNPADLLVDGYYGLSIAAERFDITRNIKFNTFATPWVFKYVMSSFYSKSPEIGVNAFSLNQKLSESTENEFDTFITEADYAAGGLPIPPDVDKEMSYFSLKDIMTSVINKLYTSGVDITDFHKAIINRNLIGGESLASISAEYNVAYSRATAEKRSLTTFIKDTLSSDYHVNSLADIV